MKFTKSEPKEFTLVVSCGCGCETTSVLAVVAPSLKKAIQMVETDAEEDERSVKVTAVFPEGLVDAIDRE